MKKIILLIFLFLGAKNFAQTNGITYQAVILMPSGEQLPGVNNSNAFLVSKDICMVFKFIDEYSNVEYQEVIQTKTDEYGMVNLVIGTGSQTAGYADSFKSIVWNSLNKNLVVGINTDGNCSSYTEISNQPFSYVPLAFSALTAENVTGVVAIENGGTNAVTVLGAKTNLGLDNVNNTSDVNKPVSTATQTELNLKENLSNKSLNITADESSDTKYPSVKAVKAYVDAQQNSDALTTEVNNRIAADLTKANIASPTFIGTVSGITATMVGLSNVDNTSDVNKPVSTATQTAIDLKVDKVTGKGLSTEDYSTVDKTKLAAITGSNTGDQDLSSFATNSNLDLKANIASPTFTGTVSGITATMVGLSNVDNTSDVNKPVSTATQTALDLKATLDSPSFIGIPSLPIGSIGITQMAGNNSQSIATTAFVTEALKTSTVGKFVDLTTNQTISGEKTFNNDIIANGLTIGKGLGQNDQNTAFGSGALGSSNADGTRNTAIGFFAMKEYVGTSFDNNTAVGYFNMIGLTTGGGNTSIGAETMFHVASGNNNTGIGNQSLIDIEGDNNVGVGKRAGDGLVSGSNNTFLGTDSRTTSLGSSISNATAIGYGAIVETDNTIQLGNTDVNLINTSANVTASSYIKLGGTSSQYLMADGSVLAVQVSAVEIADEFSATAEQTDFNLSQTPSGNCKVKMFVNGIRVSNTSYSWAGTALTYNPINNGGYDLSLNDRIQFDYYTESPAAVD